MAKYYLTNKAVVDLTNIWNYTFDEWSERQADTYYQLIIDTFNEIAKNPQSGKNYEGMQVDLHGLRVERHIVFYRIIDVDRIEITRILHQRMDLKKRIKE